MYRYLIIAGQVVAGLSILFIGSFALDVFWAESPWWQNLLGFAIHSLPTLVLIALLALSWRWPLVSGALFLVVALAPFVLLSNALWVNALLAAPAALAGALLVAGTLLRPKE